MDTAVWGGGSVVKCGCGEAEGERSVHDALEAGEKKSWSRPKHRRCSNGRAKRELDSSRVCERSSSCSSKRFELQARDCDRLCPQPLVVMKLLCLPRRLRPSPSADGDGEADGEAADGMDGLDRMARTQWTIRWRLGVAKKDAAGADPKRAGRIPPWKKAGPGRRTMGSVISSAPASAVINC